MDHTFSGTLILFCFSAINGQAGWNPSSMLSRIPGLHQAGGTMAFPQFLAMHMSANQQPACPRVSNDCPEVCRKADQKGCRVCDCSESRSYQNSGSCTDPPASCPESCRKRDDKGCKICSCDKGSSSGSHRYSAISSSTYKNCYNMIMCMLSCKAGYTLGAVTNSHGCQSCKCIDSQGKEEKQDSASSHISNINKAGSSNQNWGDVGSNSGSALDSSSAAGNDQSSGSAWQNGGTGSGNTWESNNAAGEGNKNPWENGASSGNNANSGGNNVWSAANGIGDSSSGCSGPFCPGNSGGMNPMFPGGSSNTGGGGSGSGACTGPFCAGQGGGMGGMGSTGGSGASGCTGPFCSMSGSSGGMGGASGGMGGTSGGAMGGSGGVGAFSPFGLAASAGSGSSGCSGPFCASGGDGSGGGGAAMASSFDSASLEGKYADCSGPTCSAKNGEGFQQ